MTSFRLFFSVSIIIFCAGLLGCASKLQTGGAYAPGVQVIANGATNIVATAVPDKAFFIADAAFDLAYSAADSAFNFEKRNRLFLWKISPEIKHSLDKIRPQAYAALQRWTFARDAYMEHPTPSGLSDLQTALGKMQQVADAAKAATDGQLRQ